VFIFSTWAPFFRALIVLKRPIHFRVKSWAF